MNNSTELGEKLQRIAEIISSIEEFDTKGMYVALNIHLSSGNKELTKLQFTRLQQGLQLDAPILTKYNDAQSSNNPFSANKVNITVMTVAANIATATKELREVEVYKIDDFTLKVVD